MSAYIVEDATINRVIFMLNTMRDSEYIKRPLQELGYIGKLGETLGTAMFNLNCKSINERYGEGEAASFRDLDYKYRVVICPTVIQAYKSLQCFLYQSCEGACDEDPLYKALVEVKNRLADRIVNDLPQYENSKWE